MLTIPSSRLVFARENGERLGDQAKVHDESTIIIRQIQENKKSWHIDSYHGANAIPTATTIKKWLANASHALVVTC